jgi:phospholipase C
LPKVRLTGFLREVCTAGVGGLLLPLLLNGCGGYQVLGAAVAPTVSIAAKPATILAGSSSSLTIIAGNASDVSVTGTDGSKFALQSSGGTQPVSPSATTTYTAVAAGAGGTVSAKTTVTVTASHPPTVTISAEPHSLVAGNKSTLTVKATNATQVIVTGTNGARFTLKPGGGEQTISPKVTTTYTAVATGAGGKASARVTVTVTEGSAPTVHIAADPASILFGDSSTLTVTAVNATQVTLTGTNGTKYTLAKTGGKQEVHPASTATYTALATGADGKASASATITVTHAPAPTVRITAVPKSITAGSSTILTVTATNSTQITLTGTNGTKSELPKSGGKEAVSPAKTTTYTAVATGAGGKDSASVTVTVTPNPAPTVTITADPASITSGSSSTLVVTAAHATHVTVTGSDGTTYTLKSGGGRQSVTPGKTTTYTADATGPGGKDSASATVKVTPNPAPSVTILANPTTIVSGNSSTLTVKASNATKVTVTGTDGSSYPLAADGGTASVSPAQTTDYTAVATGPGGQDSQSVTVTVNPPGSVQSIDHVIFMLQENHSFDNYFGMLNPYRTSDGKNWNIGDDGVTYNVDGIDDKLTTSNPDDEGTSYTLFKLASTCIDDDSSDWLASYGDVNRYDFTTSRPIEMNGFVHTAEGYAKSCSENPSICSGQFTDTTGERAMGYYDDTFLNYYYYMASQFALSDRWFSPVASKSIDNRIATFAGGTTQGLTKDPANDKLGQLAIPTIFEELDQASVSWKIYYTVTQGYCLDPDECPAGDSEYPATDFSNFQYSFNFLYKPKTPGDCTPSTQASSAPPVNDPTNSFCIDINHIAPLSQFFSDLSSGNLPSFAFIEAGYGRNDEHPGSGQSVLLGQAEAANILNQFMASKEWSDSVFFFSYDEGGGPYDHVPPVPGHSNDYTNVTTLGATPPDISAISVNPDSYYPCLPDGTTPYCNCPPGDTSPSLHCDLVPTDPGATEGDAPYEKGFAAQLGFRLPNMIVSPFTKKHYVSHIPMDHTAVIQFVENRFIKGTPHLTARDAAQPNLLDFFDFNNIPWATPPTPPAPYTDPQGTNSCTPASLGP